MSLVESLDLPMGFMLPEFELEDTRGRTHKSSVLFGNKGLFLIVTCNHCPYALAIWPRVIALAKHAKNLGINTVAVNPNIHPDYPEDAPERMREKISEWGIDFPYLVDGAQTVARALKAQCTPDLYLFGADQKLFYHGRLDDSWKDSAKVKRQELKIAMEGLIHGEKPPAEQFPSMGCSIKWK